jgi:thymidylate kinase
VPEIQFPFRLQPSSLIVLEGLDNAGKSTVHNAIKKASFPDGDGEPLFGSPEPYFTHQPSGGSSSLGRKIYKLTESAGGDLSNKSRQMLHLASHFQHYDSDIIPRLESGQSVFMDRNYWSTFAYGYYGEDGFHEGMSEAKYLQMVKMPLRGYKPDVVFYFGNVWTDDHHNTEEVTQGYRWLLRHEEASTVVVPPLNPDDTIMFVFKTLRELGITKVYK